MDFIFNFVSFVVLLMVIVVVHELGHFITAKYFNVYCSEFAIGMGPALYQNKIGETTFSIRSLPLGGYVQMAGEEGTDTTNVPFERTIKGIKVWQQVIVMSAGAIMNVILAWILFVGIVMARGTVSGPAKPVVAGVIDKSPAQSVGFEVGDVITMVTLADGTSFVPDTFQDIVKRTAETKDERLVFTVDRHGEKVEFALNPQLDEESGQYIAGIQARAETIEIKWYQAFGYGTKMMIDSTKQIVEALGNLLRGVGLKDMSGPVGIFQATSQITQSGMMAFLTWLGMLSLNIGIFNLFPLPILDGGRIVIILLEKLAGRKLSEKVETIIMLIGVGLVAALMLYVTWNDIWRLFGR